MRVNKFFLHALFLVICGSILTTLIFPMPRRSRESARRASCQSNLKQIALVMRNYAQDNDEKLPLVTTEKADAQTIWVNAVSSYAADENFFQCPSQDNPDKTTLGQINPDYFFNTRLSSLNTSKISKIKNVIMFGEGNSEESRVFPHFDGANYAFADGHVKWLKPETISNSSSNKTAPTFRIR